MNKGKLVGLTLSAWALVCVLGIGNSPALAQTETWHLDPPHSAAQFAVKHMGNPRCEEHLPRLAATFSIRLADPSKSSLDVTIDAASVDTRVAMRDNDLRSANYFDTAKYPTITFKSKRVEAAGSGKLEVTGDLTIHGVTKEVVLDVDGPSAPMKDPKGKEHMGLAATTTVSRQAFGVGSDSNMIGDEISIVIDVEMVKQ